MPEALSFELHKLTTRLDRAADALLREEARLSYSRFLTLFAVSQGAVSQRALAGWLGQSEPSTSRMVAVLAAEDMLDVQRAPEGGNRRLLRLTPVAAAAVERAGSLLESRFKSLVRDAGVDYGNYQLSTRRLLDTLEQKHVSAAALGTTSW
jgi:DNA-binding MarR family transcriptional regulator